MESPIVQAARWWRPLAGDGHSVVCLLCPRSCEIRDGGIGFCGVRRNQGGQLFTLSYGRPVAKQVDPIEKKPLKEFMPGTRTFSIGWFGCNLDCSFCQNHHLSRGAYGDGDLTKYIPPERIVELAVESGCASIAYTYNEPITSGEYVIDTAAAARAAGLANVLVSNGYLTQMAAANILSMIDAANIDVKGFSEDFYQRLTGGRLEPVLETIKLAAAKGVHIELTTLVIPGENESPEMLDAYFDWVAGNLGLGVPLHFSAYHPAHRYRAAPPTSPATLRRIKSAAELRGFRKVYLGNIG